MSFGSLTFMKAALAQAEAGLKLKEVPVGAVVVYKNEIIAFAHNEVMTTLDITAHAEMIAIRRAAQHQGSRILSHCDLYVTLEPCPMCATAISFARIRRLYYGAADTKGGGVDHGPRIFHSPSCHHAPEYYGDILPFPSEDLLKSFFQEKRTEKKQIFSKIAKLRST